ncbi:hypothetical protein SNE40_013670 [Patella caerulea]|uniref:Uncharacterized protein n=1 Tax=Patella caerulea TaxID=87958 RepID=A0AAN8JJS2_PATCE
MEVLPLVLVICFIGLVSSTSVSSHGNRPLHLGIREVNADSGQCSYEGEVYNLEETFQLDCDPCGTCTYCLCTRDYQNNQLPVVQCSRIWLGCYLE